MKIMERFNDYNRYIYFLDDGIVYSLKYKYYESRGVKGIEDPSWKDYWYPSSILPNFAENDEQELRNSLTVDGYQLEVEAKFIEGSSRVFKSHNINNAKEKYNYINSRQELENPNDWYITIGEINQRRLYSLVA